MQYCRHPLTGLDLVGRLCTTTGDDNMFADLGRLLLWMAPVTFTAVWVVKLITLNAEVDRYLGTHLVR